MKYLLVTWPEIQDYMINPDDFSKIYYDANKDVWFVPEDLEPNTDALLE